MSETLDAGLASTTNAAPAASEPASTPASTPAERPTSWADALKQAEEAAASPSPAPTTPEAQTPVPAIAEPPQATSEAESVGPIPLDRHKAALENARKKAAEEAAQQYQQQYGGSLEVIKALQADPVGTVIQLATELQSHPAYGQQLRSAAGRMLAAQRGSKQPSAQPEPAPEADLELQDGTQVYSALAQAKREEWLKRQMQAEFGKQLEPLRQLHQRVQRADQANQMQAQATKEASSRYQAWSQQPHFEEHKADIAKAQTEFFEQGHDSWTALGLAYAKVMKDVVLPKLQNQSKQDIVASAVAKAAGRSTNPAASVPAPPGRPKSWREALQQAGYGRESE